MIRHTAVLVLAVLALSAAPSGAPAAPQVEPLKVLATVPTYGRLAEQIGGDLVEVVTLLRPTQDMHSMVATPSIVARARGADVVLHTGFDAEPWLAPLLRQSGNVDLMPGGPFSVGMADGVRLKQVPSVVSRSQGDVHALGNPHVWTDPLVVRALGQRVRDVLADARPAAAETFTSRHAAFDRRLTEALVGWLTRYAGLDGEPVAVYHMSWIYFLDRFGMTEAATVEPKPRVTPTAGHLDDLVDTIEERGIDVVIREPYHHPQATDFLAERTGVAVVELSTHPGFPEGVDGIVEHFEWNLSRLAEALEVPVAPAN